MSGNVLLRSNSLNNFVSAKSAKKASVRETASSLGRYNSSYRLVTLSQARIGSELIYVTDRSANQSISARRLILSESYPAADKSFKRFETAVCASFDVEYGKSVRQISASTTRLSIGLSYAVASVCKYSGWVFENSAGIFCECERSRTYSSNSIGFNAK